MPRATAPTSGRPYLTRFQRWVIALSLVNLIVVAVYVVLRWLLGGWGRLGVVLTYPPQLPWLPPSLALGALALALRRWRALRWNAAAALLALFGAMGFHWSLRLGRAPAGETIRVMTYNVAGCSRGTSAMLGDVAALKPDIIALQEGVSWRQSFDPVEAILTSWPDYEARRSGGIAIISRFHFTGAQAVAHPMRRGRGSLEVRLATPHGPLTVITTHLSSVDIVHGWHLSSVAQLAALHEAQSAAVAALAEAAQAPVVVMGDFNAPPGSRAHRRLAGFGADAFSAAGRGFGYTYSSRRPLVRIDHIFAGPGVRVSRAWVPGTHGSDHRPVVADIALPPREP